MQAHIKNELEQQTKDGISQITGGIWDMILEPLLKGIRYITVGKISRWYNKYLERKRDRIDKEFRHRDSAVEILYGILEKDSVDMLVFAPMNSKESLHGDHFHKTKGFFKAVDYNRKISNHLQRMYKNEEERDTYNKYWNLCHNHSNILVREMNSRDRSFFIGYENIFFTKFKGFFVFFLFVNKHNSIDTIKLKEIWDELTIIINFDRKK